MYYQKNDTDVAHYNFNTHQPILVTFGRGVAERVLSNDDLLSHITSATVRQYLKAFLCRRVRSDLCPPELSDLTELVEAAE